MTAVAGGLASRLARLEQIVSSLQGQAGGGEQLSPNYLTVSPTGGVGASFSGHVAASGIDLPEGGAAFTNVNAVDWLDALGQVQEWIQGGTQIIGPALAHVLALIAGQQLAVPAGIIIKADTSGKAFISAQAGTDAVQVIGQDGESSFLQLTSLAQEAIASGNSSVTFTASNTSANVVVPHALGRVPAAISAVTTGTAAVPLVALASSSTTITFRGEYWTPITGTFPFSWIAIG